MSGFILNCGAPFKTYQANIRSKSSKVPVVPIVSLQSSYQKSGKIENRPDNVLPTRCEPKSAPLHNVDARTIYKYDEVIMTAIAKKLDARMNRWAPETAKKVERLVAEIIELADHDALDLVRSRQVEQEVLDIIDGRQAG